MQNDINTTERLQKFINALVRPELIKCRGQAISYLGNLINW